MTLITYFRHFPPCLQQCRAAVWRCESDRVGGVKVRWLRERGEYVRIGQMGCLSVANRMHSSPNEGVVNVSATQAHCRVVQQSFSGYFLAARPFTALTLWNSLAARR